MSSTTHYKRSGTINPNEPNTRAHFWSRFVWIMTGILIFFAYHFIHNEFEISERIEIYRQPAEAIVQEVMNQSEDSIDQVLMEVDQMVFQRRYDVDDFVDDVTGFFFAWNYSGRPSSEISRIAIAKFKREVISEQDINYQIGQSLISYRHRLNLTQDELVNKLETVFVSKTSSYDSKIRQQFNDDFLKLGQISVQTAQMTLPRIGVEIILDFAITAAIESALISAGLITGSGLAFGVSTLGISFVVSMGVNAIVDAIDDSDDKLEAECYRIIDQLREQVKSTLRKELKKDHKQRIHDYLVVVDQLARNKVEQDMAQANTERVQQTSFNATN